MGLAAVLLVEQLVEFIVSPACEPGTPIPRLRSLGLKRATANASGETAPAVKSRRPFSTRSAPGRPEKPDRLDSFSGVTAVLSQYLTEPLFKSLRVDCGVSDQLRPPHGYSPTML
jgi:hypothetical protein